MEKYFSSIKVEKLKRKIQTCLYKNQTKLLKIKKHHKLTKLKANDVQNNTFYMRNG